MNNWQKGSNYLEKQKELSLMSADFFHKFPQIFSNQFLRKSASSNQQKSARNKVCSR